ncbi:hypothetical protein E2562_002263 [Oryza meyeriana var. granulata]|uniref:Uncharacterized protein n=1 Tax=Oryza meyeriana var. granulata TaxID=110450 RepID=A0A6G1BIH3_9ORYZ|nr:hypothetical protein E2562_002263 [Oryza meyeriana var. granulata]
MWHLGLDGVREVASTAKRRARYSTCDQKGARCDIGSWESDEMQLSDAALEPVLGEGRGREKEEDAEATVHFAGEVGVSSKYKPAEEENNLTEKIGSGDPEAPLASVLPHRCHRQLGATSETM